MELKTIVLGILDLIMEANPSEEIKIINKSIRDLLINNSEYNNSSKDKNKHSYDWILFLISIQYNNIPSNEKKKLLSKFRRIFYGLKDILKINSEDIENILMKLQIQTENKQSNKKHYYEYQLNQQEEFTASTYNQNTTNTADTIKTSTAKRNFIIITLLKEVIMLFKNVRKLFLLTIRALEIIKDAIKVKITNIRMLDNKDNRQKLNNDDDIQMLKVGEKENKIIDKILTEINSSAGINIKDGIVCEILDSKASIILTQNDKKDYEQNRNLLIDNKDLLINEKKEDKPDSGQMQEDKKLKKLKEFIEREVEQRERQDSNKKLERNLKLKSEREENINDTTTSSDNDKQLDDEGDVFIIDDIYDNFTKRSEIEDKNFENLSTKKQQQISHSLERVNNEIDQKDKKDINRFASKKKV
jgi:hypothetical protein